MATSKLENAKRPSLLVEVGRFPDRLREVIGTSSVRGFAGKCGLSDAVLRSYLRGDTFPTLDRLESIAITADVRTGWLATGEGPKEKSKNPLVTEDQGKYTSKPCESCPDDDIALISRYDIQPSAGAGSFFDDEQIICHMPFSRKLLNSMGLKPENLAIVSAMGDSMHPTIKDGALLMIDTCQKEPKDGIYVLKLAGELLVKRLQRNMLDGSVTVKSDNGFYEPITAREDQLNLLDIVGRVVWSGGKI